MQQWEIGIDMGSANIRMAQRENGILFSGRSDLAFFSGEKVPFAWGTEAYGLRGRTPNTIKLRRPMLDSVLEDQQAAQLWISRMIRHAGEVHKNRRGNLLMSHVPGSRAAQEEALMRAALESGVQEVGIVRSDVAGAVGAGLDVPGPLASFVLEIGAGHIAASVWTLGRMAAGGTIPYGMNRIDEQLRRTLIAEHAFSAGDLTIERIRTELGSAAVHVLPEDLKLEVAGFDLKERISCMRTFTPFNVYPTIHPMIQDIVFLLHGLIAQIPEELAADLIDSGLTVIGGGAQLPGLCEALSSALDVPCTMAEDPENAVVRGLHEIILHSNHYDSLVTDRLARGN